MEGGAQVLTQEASPSENKEEWIAAWIDELCPYYLHIGVPYDEFWHGDYTALKHYVRANEMERQRKSEEMWLQGLYIYNAVSVSLANAFGKKGSKKQKYLDEPMQVVPLTESELAAKAEVERRKAIDYFSNLAAKWEKKK